MNHSGRVGKAPWTLIAIVLMVIFVGVVAIRTNFPQLWGNSFDSELWKSDVLSREQMVKDIVYGGVLNKTMTESDVLSMLGPETMRHPASSLSNTSRDASFVLYYKFVDSRTIEPAYVAISIDRAGQFCGIAVTHL